LGDGGITEAFEAAAAARGEGCKVALGSAKISDWEE
jgi:hypothetical protein